MECPYIDEGRAYVRRGGYYPFAPEYFVSMLEAWKKGDTFFQIVGTSGEEVHIKLAEVESIMFFTAEMQDRAKSYLKSCEAYEGQEWHQ